MPPKKPILYSERGRHADLEKEQLLETDDGADRVSGLYASRLLSPPASYYDKVSVVATMDKVRPGMGFPQIETPNLIVVVERKKKRRD